MLSYVAHHNGITNEQLNGWLLRNEYSCIDVDVQFANSKKREEVLITNYYLNSNTKNNACNN